MVITEYDLRTLVCDFVSLLKRMLLRAMKLTMEKRKRTENRVRFDFSLFLSKNKSLLNIFWIEMEFPFDVDAILPFDVTIVDSDYRILNRAQINKSFHDRSAAERFSSIIDSMGDASYKVKNRFINEAKILHL